MWRNATAEKLFLSGSFIRYASRFVYRKECFSLSQAYMAKSISVFIASEVFFMSQVDLYKTNYKLKWLQCRGREMNSPARFYTR
jgi:hypothetical protein